MSKNEKLKKLHSQKMEYARKMFHYNENGDARMAEDTQTKMFATMGKIEFQLGGGGTSSFSEKLKEVIEPFKCDDLGVYLDVGNYNQIYTCLGVVEEAGHSLIDLDTIPKNERLKTLHDQKMGYAREIYYSCENGDIEMAEESQTKMFATMGKMEFQLGVDSTTSFSENLKEIIEPFKCEDLGAYRSAGNYNQIHTCIGVIGEAAYDVIDQLFPAE